MPRCLNGRGFLYFRTRRPDTSGCAPDACFPPPGRCNSATEFADHLRIRRLLHPSGWTCPPPETVAGFFIPAALDVRYFEGLTWLIYVGQKLAPAGNARKPRCPERSVAACTAD